MRLRGCNLARLGDIYIMTRSRLGACLGAAVAGYCCCSFSGAILSTHKKVHLKEIFSIFFVLFRWNKSKTAKKNCSTLMLPLKCASSLLCRPPHRRHSRHRWSLRYSRGRTTAQRLWCFLSIYSSILTLILLVWKAADTAFFHGWPSQPLSL